jgi:transaldolase
LIKETDMKRDDIKTRIFLDSGDPANTREIIGFLGFLDGQTTNPTLISKNPEAADRLRRGERFSEKEIFDFYRKVVTEISGLIPAGSVSVEVFADLSTKHEHMLEQGTEMFSWIPNAHIKFPSSVEGLKAAELAVKTGLRVNMTLCFSQEQAAAIYAATKGASPGDVFVSPFVGRLDDIKENGMDLIANIVRMYDEGDHHVQVLAASLRTLDHLYASMALGSDIVTVPFDVLKMWAAARLPLPENGYRYAAGEMKDIPYRELDLSREWKEFDITHALTTKGMEKFSADWNQLIGR